MTKSKDANLNIRLSPIEKDAFSQKCEEMGLGLTQAVIGAIQILCKIDPDPKSKVVKDIVEREFKRIIGREQFIAFLDSVKEVIPSTWKEITPNGAGEDFVADTWISQNKQIGLYASFSANGEASMLMAKAVHLIEDFHFQKLFIITNEKVSDVRKKALENIGVEIVSLSSFKSCLEKLESPKKLKSSKSKK